MPSLVKEPMQERRGLDYASLSFFSATVEHQGLLARAVIDLFEQLWPSGEWRSAGRSAHFESVYMHVTGARLELSAPGSDASNPGVLLLTLPGGSFYLQPSGQAAFMVWFLTRQDGFRWFTRLDFQSTELDPAWPVTRVIAGVEARELWVGGFSTYRLWAERSADSTCQGGATLYWGSPRSDRQCRSYDKSVESGWRLPAIRDEVQLRRGWARSAGLQLIELLESNMTTDAMDKAIQDMAAGVINQHLQYWTLNGADPQGDKNWKRKAEPADWFADRIGRSVASIRKAPRPVQDLEATVSWGIQQYGRFFALSVFERQRLSGMPLHGIWEGLCERFVARLTNEDVAALLEGASEAEAAEFWGWIQETRDAVAWEGEHGDLPVENGTPVL
jgi:hypothetical protein